MAHADRNGQPWTADDIHHLRRLAESGMDAGRIAEAMHRTTVGIKSKALSLRIALKPRRQSASARLQASGQRAGSDRQST